MTIVSRGHGVTFVDVGQRVFVLRDKDRVAINRWGTIVRIRKLDNGAWVRLDSRHERCPFPAGDRRESDLIAYPDDCSSAEPTQEAQ